MFCYQCEETVNGKGCTIEGICGKTHVVANLQDLLIYLAKGISVYANKARELGVNNAEVDLFVIESLFSTVTNVNFDQDRMIELIKKAFYYRDDIKNMFFGAYKAKNANKGFEGKLPDACIWHWDGSVDSLYTKAISVSILSEANEDIRSLRELLVYGLKGIAAYADHAYILGKEDNDILAFVEEGLAATLDNTLGAQELVGLVMKAGEYAVKTMALLDNANTSAYGNPEITQVFTGTKEGPAILVSGHDLLDLEEILKQTQGTGINVYTHGEMLPANAYPKLKKYSNLVGNYGTSWYNQQKEFEAFNGAIVMTTNCLQRPKDSYRDRMFTTGLVAWPQVQHIKDRVGSAQKDFSAVIEKALALGGLEETPGKYITIGFAHVSAIKVAAKIVDAVKSGSIKRFVVMAGCDGRHKERNYFSEVARQLPEDAVILTAGCAKYRYNMLDLGDIGGIPRVIDAGQCNDSYSLVVIAQELAKVFKVKDINELPVSFDIAWYEQKAVCVLLALLYLGVKNIRLGPNLPAFISPAVLKVLVEKFDIKPISTPEKDIEAMLAAK
ncbi:MAG: hydroxylamine reductase [Candidatus Omnitrophota bacterium]|nr:MAG: hydroxylamine reductase [Candidatus Omnitrophota bacterium]